MFAAAFVSFFALSALAPSVSAVPSHGLVRNVHRSVPTQFKERGYAVDEEILEPYKDYAERYELLDCKDQHNTTFWDNCCHPLLKTQTEDDLPEQCMANLTNCDEPTTSAHISAPLPTTTHVVDKPAPTTSEKPITTSVEKPITTSVEKPIDKPTTTIQPETTKAHTTHVRPTTSSVSGGGGGGGGGSWVSGGKGTYYYQQGNFGACGKKHSDNDLIVAIDIHYYGYNTGVVSPYCGKKLRVVNTDNGKTVDVIVADVCPTCDNNQSLDMSVATFKALEPDLGVGMLNIKYQVLN